MGIRAHYNIEAHMDNDLSVEVAPIITLCQATTAADIPAETDAHPEIDIAAHIYLCRDKCPTVRLILKPRSIVILGGRKRWWSVEQKLARVLKKDGHHVIFAESR